MVGPEGTVHRHVDVIGRIDVRDGVTMSCNVLRNVEVTLCVVSEISGLREANEGACPAQTGQHSMSLCQQPSS